MGKVAELHVGEDDLSKFRREAAREPAVELTEYEYLDAAGDLEFIAVRQDFTDDRKKQFRPFSPDGTSGYPKGDRDRTRPLYNLPKVVSKPSGGVKVIVVEGEKCVAAAEGVFPEAVVVTWVGGGNAIDKTDWKPLDVSVVLLLTDTDEPGRLAMRKIAGKLKRLNCTVLQYAREGDDRSDIFEWSQGLDAAGLRDLRDEIEAGACDPKRAGQPVAEAAGQSLDFETVEPWEGKVDGAEVLAELAGIVRTHMHMDDYQADAVALWVALAWLHDHPDIELAPFLNITAPVMRSGKTTLLGIVEQFVPRPLPLVDASPAFLFRVIEISQPTLLVDEIDLKADDDGHLSALLNGSQTRHTAYIGRVEKTDAGKGAELVPKKFRTWCPKVLCGIGGLRDTTVDRSIQIRLERRTAKEREKTTRWRERDKEKVETIRRKLVRWINDHRKEIVDGRTDTALPPSLDDRQADSWEPLLAIANRAGGVWKGEEGRGWQACLGIVGAIEYNASNAELLIRHVRAVFLEEGDPAYLTTATLLEGLRFPDWPWGTWTRGKPITAHALGRMLKPFGLRSKNQKIEGKVLKVYELAPLERVSIRYSATDGSKDLNVKEKTG